MATESLCVTVREQGALQVRDACQAEIDAGRLRTDDMSVRVISLLNDMKVGGAIDVRFV